MPGGGYGGDNFHFHLGDVGIGIVQGEGHAIGWLGRLELEAVAPARRDGADDLANAQRFALACYGAEIDGYRPISCQPV